MTDLPGYIQQFVRGSSYRFGDNTSFKIYIDKERSAAMPGRHDPRDYLDQLGVGSFNGNAAVICPGNGGLVADLIYRGAKEVYAFEPRTVFTKGLEGVLSIIRETSEYTVTTKEGWPKKGECEGKFDLIIWPEGLDLSVNPHAVFSNVLYMLSEEGVLFIELCQGLNTNSNPEKINRWMPTSLAFQEFIKGIDPSLTIEETGNGRLDRRVIYKINADLVVIVDDDPAIESQPESPLSPVSDESKSAKTTSKKNKKNALAKIAQLKRDKQKQEVAAQD